MKHLFKKLKKARELHKPVRVRPFPSYCRWKSSGCVCICFMY